jgi:hypothetical protein
LACILAAPEQNKTAFITVGWTTEKGKLTKIKIREKDDLPKHITGRAV